MTSDDQIRLLERLAKLGATNVTFREDGSLESVSISKPVERPDPVDELERLAMGASGG